MSLATDMQALLKAHGSQAVLAMLASGCEGLAMLAFGATAETDAFKASAMIADAAKLVGRIERRREGDLHEGIAMQEEVAEDLARSEALDAAVEAAEAATKAGG